MSHTPGSWRMDASKGFVGLVVDSKGADVAQAMMRGGRRPQHDTERAANAALIAAAPELLEACDLALDIMEREHRATPPIPVRSVVVAFAPEDIAKVRAAVAKARGT